jgi:hypothetical protein
MEWMREEMEWCDAGFVGASRSSVNGMDLPQLVAGNGKLTKADPLRQGANYEPEKTEAPAN